MISETEKDTLVESLKSVDFTVNGHTFAPRLLREGEDITRTDSAIVVNFLPTGKKYGVGVSTFMGNRDNPNYQDYGYGEEERLIVKACALTQQGIHGRNLCNAWLTAVERYIRYNWSKIINIIDFSVGPYQYIPNPFVEKQFIYQMEFRVVSQHAWSNEPIDNSVPAVNVTGMEVNNIWVN